MSATIEVPNRLGSLAAPPPQATSDWLTRYPIRTRLAAYSVTHFAFFFVVCTVAIVGRTTLRADSMDAIDATEIVRTHMEADMMHDALRADVYHALASAPADQAEVTHRTAEHVDLMEASIATLTEKTVGHADRATVETVTRQLHDYARAAQDLSALATRDHDAALAGLPAFEQQFDSLEAVMRTTGDTFVRDANDSRLATLDRIDEAALIVVLAAAFGAVGGAIISRVFQHAIVESLQQTETGLRAFANGDCRTRVAIRGQDEIASMNKALNECVEHTNVAVHGVSVGAKSLSSNAASLTSVAENMHREVEGMGMRLQAASSGADQVSSSVQAVATGVEEMSVAMREVARNAVEAARVASTAVQSAQETSAAVGRLGQSGADIGKVVKVISTIAHQTNLLALNATIEAARAGEAGRGFAVVANEVKELARETAKATDDIAAKIEAIQADTRVAVSTNEQIALVIGQINDLQSAIAGAVEEQTATSNQIARNLQEAASASAEVASGISASARATSSASAGAAEFEQATSRLARLAVELEATCAHFQT